MLLHNDLFSVEVATQILKGVFINQKQVENGQEQISFGLGIANPQLDRKAISFTRTFCKKE